MNKKEYMAKAIRIFMIPPIVALVMIIGLYKYQPNIFKGLDCLVAFIGLFFLPILAYPTQKFITKFKEKGREGQRKMAFVFTMVGYFLTFVYGEWSHVSNELRFIFRTYLVAVLILSFVNKILRKRASGHACSIVSSLLFISYFIGGVTMGVCIVFLFLSFWSSLVLKRHKLADLIIGSLTSIFAFGISYLLTIM